MIGRVLPLYKPLLQQFARNAVRSNIVRDSSHGANYRVAPPPPPAAVRYGGEIVSTLMWWWILWHLYHEPEHIYGEFPYPSPSDWTNNELGIPSV